MFRAPKSYMNTQNKKLKERMSQKLETTLIPEILQETLKQKIDLKKKIKITLKYFIKDHKKVEIEAENGSTLSEALKAFLSSKKFENHTLKSIYQITPKTPKKISKISKTQKVHTLETPSHLLLLLSPSHNFCPKNTTSAFKLSKTNSKITLPKEHLKDGLIFEMSFLNFKIAKPGRFFWQITIHKILAPENLLLGIAKPDIDKKMNPFDSGKFWGFQPLM